MKMKFGLILVLLVLSIHVFSQLTYKTRISGQKIFNKESGERISDKELQNLIDKNPNIILEPCINKFGSIESFEVDPNRTNPVLKRDVLLRTQRGEQFPQFIMRTIENNVFDLEKLKGKNVLIQFQLRFKEPFFKETTLSDFCALTAEFKKTTDIVAFVVSESPKEEIVNSIDVNNYNIDIVPNGRNFNHKYLVVDFPTLVLIDSNGKLIGYYNQLEIPKLKSDIKKL